MKHDWKTEEKAIYLPKSEPVVIEVPKYKYFTLTGTGNPNNNSGFQERIEILYSLSYTIKMSPKKGTVPAGYFEYSVYPLEGVWDMTKKGRTGGAIDKDEFVYKIMIRQPDFVTPELAAQAIDAVKKKKTLPLVDAVRFEEVEDGLCVQMMHIGPFDDEPKNFEKMKAFIEASGYKRKELTHREIYLSDFRKTASEKLKTVLRYSITE